LLAGLDEAGREGMLERLRSEREPYYRRADLRVDTSRGDVEAVARAVVAGVRRHAERSIAVRLPGAGYQVVLEEGGAAAVAKWVARLLPPEGSRRRLGVVGDEVVLGLHGRALCTALRDAGYDVAVVEVPSGEAAKTWRVLEEVLGRLLDAGLQRGSVVLGFGGGSTTDVAGLAAALFKRGVPVVQVPTTLLAMLDAAVGGKTAINHSHGKNLIGAFHQPALVVAPLAVLQTLPEEELRAAMGEVLKMALLEGEAGLAWAESLPRPRPWSEEAIVRLLLRSVRGKARVVERDPEETKGVRVHLNLGHTLGHAIEHAGGLRHGEAVGLGLLAACRLSVALGHMPPGYEERVRGVLEAWHLPVDLVPRLSEAVWRRLSSDKKARGAAIEWVLPTSGGVEVVSLTSAQVRGILGTP
jgi:3-dehydroquinate synthase